MSEVTNLIICFSTLENENEIIIQFQKFIHNEHPFHIALINDQCYGGEKFLECIILIGAYNFLDIKKLIQFMINEISWDAPDLVQIIIKKQDDIKFRLIGLFDEYN